MHRGVSMTEAELDAIIGGLEGWCTPQKARVLYDLVLKTDSQLSVELGVFGGRSLIPMALAHKYKARGFVTGVDAWEVQAAVEALADQRDRDWWGTVDLESIYIRFLQAMIDNEVTYHGRWIRAKSEDAVRMFGDGTVTILHQDSNHSELVSCQEVRLWSSKVLSGGYWIMDDTDWLSTRKAQGLLLQFGFRIIRDEVSWMVYQKR
jgi:hypothetical protein